MEEMEDKKREISEKNEDYDSTMNANPEKELLNEEMLKKSTSPPFPQALHGKRGIRNASKFLKGLTVNKKAFLTEQVSAILQCKSPLKYKDPGSPTILVMIGGKVVEKALLDLAARCKFASILVYKQLGLGELKPTTITLSLADRLVKIPRGEWAHATHFCNMTLDLNIFYMSKKQTTPEEEEGLEEVCIIDTLVKEHCNQNMQDKLNESLADFEEDQENTTFTCPFGTYAYRRMPFGLCNAPATFERCMLSIFSDMVERIMEVFMDDITVYGGIVLGHIISEKGIEVDKAKVELIVKLSSPTTVKGVRQFLGHASFYRRCQNSFDQLKKFLTTTPIVRAPNWQLPFELMCDDSDFAIGAVFGQREDGKPYVIYYASKTLNEAQRNYTTTEKELLVVEALLCKIHAYYWEEPFIFKYCADQIIRKCVPEEEQQGILNHCHENACGGHFASQKTTIKVLQSGLLGHLFSKMPTSCVEVVIDAKGLGRLTKRNQMPMNPILIVELFDVWALTS
ncbi:Retrovirus-related Pol polyprotein from transposon 17.6 [Vitis vinifera]|uniref:Retrovirus-related Pol polyprotein from transposon 17.6 n=1 Tax=Vitis vinifera TaxID=29760 RepID=A0A438HHD7_VITVI|nr:Retrovirus-related Pol polyprotein from transposon 17.6 [Vitis vinifera]